MRLRTKIIFLMISVTLVMSVLLVRSQDVLLRDKLEESQVEWVRTLVRAVAESIAQNIIDSDQLETRALLRRIVNNEEAISYIFITNFEGHLFTHTFDNGFPKVLIKHMQAEDHEASSGYLMDGEIIRVNDNRFIGHIVGDCRFSIHRFSCEQATENIDGTSRQIF